MAIDDKSSLELFRALKGMAPSATKTATARATVTSDGFVVVDGAATPTPVEGATVSASVGDVVEVRNSDGGLVIVGNYSNPPTDDKAANMAIKAADDASRTATNFLDFTDADGLVVGNIFEAILRGNVQLTQDGTAGVVNLRDGRTVLASFQSDGVSFKGIDFRTIDVNDDGEAMSFIKCQNGVIFCSKAPGESGYSSEPKIKISGDGIEGLGYGITSQADGFASNVEITTGTPYKTVSFVLSNQSGYPILKGWRSSSSSIVPYGVYFDIDDNGRNILVLKLRNVSSSKATATITAEVDYIN